MLSDFGTKNFLIQSRMLFLYFVFGGLTTVLNLATYYLLFYIINIDNVPSVIISWIVAVSFAYISNRYFVFKSKNITKSEITIELISFFTCRFFTGLLDLGIMYFACDIMHGNNMIWKITSNLIVIIMNFIASKFFIFVKK